ncbi:hypothetical protein [Paraburkholderia piptadeniae]|nr:hypothetical protein [Paraburkholderia piptadeniae]
MSDQQRDDCTNADTENDGEFPLTESSYLNPSGFSRPASRSGGVDRG